MVLLHIKTHFFPFTTGESLSMNTSIASSISLKEKFIKSCSIWSLREKLLIVRKTLIMLLSLICVYIQLTNLRSNKFVFSFEGLNRNL